MRIHLTIAVALYLAVGALVSNAPARSGTNHVVAKGQVATALPGWPQGAIKLINDPLRLDGWQSWSSGVPSDFYFFSMDVRNPKDVNHLIGMLSSIDAKTVQLNLDPAKGAPHAGGVGAIFSLGSIPPTLTVYVGHEAVELNELKVPRNIALTTATAKSYRDAHKEAFQQIDQFIASLKAKQKQSRIEQRKEN